MRSAAFWAGKTTRSHHSYDHNADGKTTSRQFGNTLEPEELMPRQVGEARLLVRGTPGQMVELLEWTDFVDYLDQLRAVTTTGVEVIRLFRRPRPKRLWVRATSKGRTLRWSST
jgi:type IV secretion system protein VirD4